MSGQRKCQECGSAMVYRNGGVPGVDTPPMNPGGSGRDRTLVCESVYRTGEHDWDTLAQEAAVHHEHGQSHPTDGPDHDAPEEGRKTLAPPPFPAWEWDEHREEF